MFTGKTTMRWLAFACVLFGLGASGCQTDAFCFVCHTPPDAGPVKTGNDGGTTIFIPPPPTDSGMHVQTDTGAPLGCNADLSADPNNCGSCGNVCAYAGALGKCVDGSCAFDKCADGFVDVNKNTKDGCECTVTNGGKEICDEIDNDCNGKIDDGFDLQTDVNNCGACNVACPTLPHSTLTCAAGDCHYGCDGGYSDLGQKGVGCPYQCPVQPSIPETCNGVDDDCDGIIDNGDPGAGVPCDDNCPNGKCVGECASGTTVCSGTKDGVVCVGGTRPTVEVCDGKDNDCDGTTDNGFDLKNDPLNCGICGRQCKIGTNCLAGVCDFKCDPNQRDLDGDPSNGCEYTCPVFPIQAEVCDGIDQDCDGIADNGATDVGKACTGSCPAPDACVATGNCGAYKISTANGACYGVCSANGTTACVAGLASCTYSTQRLDELCNNVDDNCDGRIDEGFDLKNDPANCGACGKVCSVPNSLAVSCVNGACSAVTACQPGFKDLNGQELDGCEYKCPIFPPVGESCNGVDDNCDGIIDNSPAGSGQSCTSDCPAPAPCIAAGNCTLQVASNTSGCYGACAFEGRTSCGGAGSNVCTHPGKVAETCNGLDDDCDGLIDNGFNLFTDMNNCGFCGNKCALPGTTAASCVAGTCRSTACTPGFVDLDGDATNGCEYACPVFPIKTETCNGLDDDCDGVKDDSPTDAGKPCTGSCPAPDACVAAGNCSPSTISANTNGCYGVCRNGGTSVCTNGALACSYASLETPETCNNADDNCDGRIDEGFNKQTDPNNCGACGTVCTAVNAAARLCTAGACGAITACASGFKDINGNPGDGCEYKCPVFPPVGESCNGIDDDCNGTKDDNITGLGGNCTNNCPVPNGCVAAGNCTTAVSPNTNGCYGVCATDGRTSCSAGATVCNHVGATAETCNGVDDNCDGRIDEGFNKTTDVNNCGGCGIVCALPGATAVCVGGLCAVNNCTAGRADVDKNPANGCEYACPVFPIKAETCNGVDDDCDGVIDDTPTDVGVACSDNCPGGTCKGICTTGTTTCISGSKVCQGGGGVKLEVCNNKDDDCDGVTDNGFDTKTDPLNCGGCGQACNLANTSVNSCVASACVPTQCDPGFANNDGNNLNGCEYTCPVYPTRTEICNGVDDDCDGKVDTADTSLVTPANFCVQTGPCSGSKPLCTTLGTTTAWHCNYDPTSVEITSTGTVALSEARCDGKDGNCNGQSDESFPLKNQPCSVGKGICAGNSTYACTTDLTGVQCPAVATPNKAVDEDCNGADDNCDGNIDERNPTIPAGGLLCFNGAQHTCLGWVDPMVKTGAAVWTYTYEASRTDANALLGGTASTRACSKVTRVPWSSLNYPEAAAACAAVKNSAGNAMRLCTETEWQTACQDNNAANLWSYSAAPTVYVAGECNDNDPSNPGAPWATGSGATCYANWGAAGHIFDMSGNLSEWTSTSATSNGVTYQRVRGGNYQTFPNGTKCNFGFVLQQPTFQNFDLGFRCCSDAAP